MMRFYSAFITAVALFLSSTLSQAEDVWSTPAEVSARLGRQSVIIPLGRGDIQGGFPDMPIAVLKRAPLTFLMVCGNDTYLWSGQNLSTAIPIRKVLSPGPAGSVDNNYAGISSIYQDQKNQRLIAFYHAEDKEGIGHISNGVQGFYARICVAQSPLKQVRFTKLGPAITADQPKKPRGWETEGGPREAWMAQGAGDPSVCIDASGQYLLCMYGEYSNRLKASRGVQLCIARAPIDSSGMPGSWSKFYRGKFSEPGLNGHDSPVITGSPIADTGGPHLQYVPEWKRYIVVFGVVHHEINATQPRPVECGVYVSTSREGTVWT